MTQHTHLVEQHWHTWCDDRTDQWITVPVRAVHIDAVGPTIELGSFSLSPDDARLLADSLRLLAHLVDPKEQTP